MGRLLIVTLIGLVAVFLAAFFVWPIVITVGEAFIDDQGRLTGAFIAEVFRHPIYWEGLLNALRMGVFSTLLAILIAMPLAVVADRYAFPGKTWFASLVLVPLILPPFVGAIGIKQLLATERHANGQSPFLRYLTQHIARIFGPSGATCNNHGSLCLLQSVHKFLQGLKCWRRLGDFDVQPR